ncbi:MAG: divergent polysaccharide deacetylase family protein [Treponema sp.]
MSAAKRKSSVKKSSSKKRKSTRSRKPKIKLDKSSVALFTGIIALACVALLAASVFMNSPKKENSEFAKQKSSVEKEESENLLKQSSKKQQADNSSSNKSAKTQSKSSSKSESETSSNASSTSKTDSSAEKKSSETNSESSNKTKSTSEKKISSAKQNSLSSSKSTSPSKNIVVPKSEPSIKKEEPSKPTEPSAPVVPYDIPFAKPGATLVFIFDDAGQSVSKVKRYTDLPLPLAIAVLPKLPHSKDCADFIRASGKEVMLHQPMQAENLKINPGAGAILPNMTTYEVAEIVKQNIAEVGPVAGLNNHEGSLITEDVIKIGTVLDVASEKGIYFVDSRTTSATMAPQAALERDFKILQRDVFLDDVVNKDDVLKQIYRALDIANKNGKAIIIGHVDKSVDIIPALLRDMYPYLREKGYRFALPSQVWK